MVNYPEMMHTTSRYRQCQIKNQLEKNHLERKLIRLDDHLEHNIRNIERQQYETWLRLARQESGKHVSIIDATYASQAGKARAKARFVTDWISEQNNYSLGCVERKRSDCHRDTITIVPIKTEHYRLIGRKPDMDHGKVQSLVSLAWGSGPCIPALGNAGKHGPGPQATVSLAINSTSLDQRKSTLTYENTLTCFPLSSMRRYKPSRERQVRKWAAMYDDYHTEFPDYSRHTRRYLNRDVFARLHETKALIPRDNARKIPRTRTSSFDTNVVNELVQCRYLRFPSEQQRL